MSIALRVDPSPPLGAVPPPLPPDSVYTPCYCEENVYLLARRFTQLSEVHATERRGPWPWQIFVVFISNGGKTVALWSQKARDGVVVWDYHVVLVLLPRAPHDSGDGSHIASGVGSDSGPFKLLGAHQAWVYDFDTILPVPCPWREYIAGTFPYALDESVADRVDSRFHRYVSYGPDWYWHALTRSRPACGTISRTARSLFRVIPAGVYLDHFASDRSHMIVPALVGDVITECEGDDDSVASASDGVELSGEVDGGGGGRSEVGVKYASPPPAYPPLRGAKAREMGVVHNLMESFVEMGLHWPAPLAEEFVEVREGEGQVVGRPAAEYGQVMRMGDFVKWLSGSSGEP
ncbi:N-terminal glutamine amidase-domain-containing protein [Trametes meyenii]|nr:N-terminal glutamine amidase-domain-containing protein [Trametes meyenii]